MQRKVRWTGLTWLFGAFSVACLFPNRLVANDNPLITQLITTGVQTVDGKSIPLPPPRLTDNMSAGQQAIAVAEIAAEKGEDRFYRDSTVSPFVLTIESIKKFNDRSQVQQVDIYFAVHGNLEDIEDKKLLERLSGSNEAAEPNSGKQKDDGLPQDSRELTADELKKAGVSAGNQPDGTKITYGILQANLLDKAFLSLVTKSHLAKSDQSLTLALTTDANVADKIGSQSEWYPIVDDRSGKLKLGKPESYQAAAAYIKATQLKSREDILFVEVHVLFVEPHGWFQGRNLLRSKLPPVIQDAVRTFRRKLADR